MSLSDRKLLVIDTETGGLDPRKHSLLSLGCVVWSAKGIGDSMEIAVAEDTISFEEEALNVNKIEMKNHIKNGVSPKKAIVILNRFINANFNTNKITLAGHNISFDKAFLKRMYRMGGGDYDRRYSHRSLDTASILMFLGLSQTIPEGLESSDAAFDYFDIEFDPGKRHTAKADAQATAQLISKLTKCLANKSE
jgi:DNA polymerase-3 subunit epsilon